MYTTSDEHELRYEKSAELFGLKCLLRACQLFNPFLKKENDLKGHPVKFVYF